MSAGLVAPTFAPRLLRRQGRRWRRPTGHGEESTRVRRSHLDYSLVLTTNWASAGGAWDKARASRDLICGSDPVGVPQRHPRRGPW